MIRRIQLSLSNTNPDKLRRLDRMMDEALRVVNYFVDCLWQSQDFDKYARLKAEDTWLSARLQQVLVKQAAEMCKSQQKRRHKTKPVIRKASISFDQRFVLFIEDINTFDFWS